MEKLIEIMVGSTVQHLSKKDIVIKYERNEIKPWGFIGIEGNGIRTGFDVLYWDGNNVVVIDVTNKRVYATRIIYQKKDVKFSVDGEYYSLEKDMQYLRKNHVHTR